MLNKNNCNNFCHFHSFCSKLQNHTTKKQRFYNSTDQIYPNSNPTLLPSCRDLSCILSQKLLHLGHKMYNNLQLTLDHSIVNTNMADYILNTQHLVQVQLRYSKCSLGFKKSFLRNVGENLVYCMILGVENARVECNNR